MKKPKTIEKPYGEILDAWLDRVFPEIKLVREAEEIANRKFFK